MSTIISILGSDSPSSSRADINANFANLNSDKVESLSDLSITASATELNYCDGVTSNIQTQLDTKDAHIVGEIRMVAFGEGSIPSGWLICDGAEVSRTTYSTLFSAIGTSFGTGNGSTTFNVPDLRGRVPGGKDDMGQGAANTVTATEADSLGGEYGTETHTLTVDEMPTHSHEQRSGSGSGSADGFDDSNTYSGNATDNNLSTATTGGGSAHNNMQPTLFLNFIIKT